MNSKCLDVIYVKKIIIQVRMQNHVRRGVRHLIKMGNNKEISKRMDTLIAKRKTKKPECSICGEEMENAVDSITKEISKYLWKTKCGHNEHLLLSIG